MRELADSSPRWEVSTRSSGEVLTASAAADDLSLTLVGVPDGFTPREISGWLEDVAGVARETSHADAAPKPIPHLLHHALTGLLFSQSELWSLTPGPAPCSVGFVRSENEIGFGWVGEAEVWVWLDGNPIEVQWVLIRDSLGRTACAWSIDPGHSLAVRVRWSASLSDPAAPTVDVDAVWTSETAEMTVGEQASGEPATLASPVDIGLPTSREPWTTTSRPAPPVVAHAPDAVAPRAVSPPAPIAHAPLAPEPARAMPPVIPEPEEIAAAAESAPMTAISERAIEEAPEAPSSGVARWLMHSVPWLKKPERPVRRVAQPEESQELVASAEPSVEAPAQKSVPPVVESIPASHEPLVPLSSALETQGFDAIEVVDPTSRTGRAIPDAIPPTPEAVEITERAVPLHDPRSLSLPVRPMTETERRSDPPRLPKQPAAPPEPAPVIEYETPFESTLAPESSTTASPARTTRVAPPASVPPTPAAPPPSPPPFELGRVEVRSAARPTPASAAPVLAPEHESLETAPAIEEEPRITFEPDPHPDASVLRRASWPTAEALDEEPLWKKPWAWVAPVAALLVIAWIFAGFSGSHKKGSAGPKGAPLGVVGFGGPRFKAKVESDPPGAHIAIDGTDTEKETPATIDVPVGDHQLTLSLPGLGQATYPVTGKKGDEVPVQAKLVGTLQVISPDPKAVISVSLDGEAKGFAPIELEGLVPGPHEVRFSGPGIASWGRTVEIRIGETYPILTRALESPATGLIDVRATVTDEQGQNPANGGQVWVDGVSRGAAPQTLELPRGPHSIRMAYRGQEAPIQVIDLPGGNQRFATFEFGPAQEAERPRIVLAAGAVRVPSDKPAVVSATFENTSPSEVREMWLHVKSPEGAWRRIQMTLLSSQGTVVGVSPFPATLLDGSGKSTYYVSGIVAQGDEYFTELEPAQAEKR